MSNYTITIYKNSSSTAVPYKKNVLVAFERIKQGVDLKIINEIRFEKDKIKQAELKKQLCAFCFSGSFSHRSSSGLITHSGIICISMEGFQTEEELNLYRKAFMESKDKAKYTFALFTSVSGSGLKCLIKIPAEEKYHKAYFNALKEFYNDPHFETDEPDVSALTFSSYDPDLYFNPESEVWLEKDETEVFDLSEKTPVLKLQAEIGIVSNLEKMYEKKFPKEEGDKKTNLIKLCLSFNEFGVKQAECERYIVSKYKDKIKEKELLTIIKSAYKQKGGTKFFEDKQALDLLERQIRSGIDTDKIYKKLKETGGHSKDDVESAIKIVNNELPVAVFWYFTDRGKVMISNEKFKAFLEQRGYYKYYPEGSENFIFIRIENNMVEVVKEDEIKSFVLKYLLDQSNTQPFELMSGNSKYFKNDYLNLIEEADIKFYEDTVTSGVVFFKNGAVVLNTTSTETKEQTDIGIKHNIIKSTNVELIDYFQLDGHVWKDQIIQRDYKECDFGEAVYGKFIHLVAGKDEKSELSIKSTIGYLMHSHKTSANNKAVILNDSTISDNPNGGSGKGIYCAGIGYIKRMSVINGKKYDPSKAFSLQTVDPSTQILVYDDVSKKFDFETHFSDITEGITIEKKNKDAIKLTVEKSPKIVITTNYTIGGTSGSFERRKWELEFSSFFSASYTPFQHFGHNLFYDWNEEEWMRFDNYMIHCFKIYLEQGLIRQSFKNLKERQFINETSFDFREWITEEPSPLPMNVALSINEYYVKFIGFYPDYAHSKWFTQRKFCQWLEKYGEHRGFNYLTGTTLSVKWIKFWVDSMEQPTTKEVVEENNIIGDITERDDDEFAF
jgi:hypothetical protein